MSGGAHEEQMRQIQVPENSAFKKLDEIKRKAPAQASSGRVPIEKDPA
jgi:hypothetical protein